VGSGHLVGETGLVALLQKQGFTVDQVFAHDQNPEQIASKSTANMTKYAFLDDKFRVWLPGQPQRKDLPGQEPRGVQYMLTDFGVSTGANVNTSFGMFGIFCFEFPTQQSSWRIPGPLALDIMLAPLTKLPGSETLLRRSVCLDKEFVGRE